MYATRKILLLSACLLPYAHVPEGNVAVCGQNISVDASQHRIAGSGEPRNAANTGRSVPIAGNAYASAVAMIKNASATAGDASNDPNDAFRDADRLEEQTDAITAMLQQQLFAPHDGNLILQAVKHLPEEEPTPASVETIADALKVRLSDALRKICPYDMHELDTLTLQLAEVIRAHGIRQKRPLALFNPEDIRCLTASLYRVLQEIDIQRLIAF